MKANIPITDKKRVVIVGAGFAGLKLARKLLKSNFQIVLIDRYNYHQFQPLFYQVATAGLEPSAISFPLRKVFQKHKNIHIRITEVFKVESEQKMIVTALGNIDYDYLVLAIGADTNYFNMPNIEKYAYPMKAVPEAMALRNKILSNFEKALSVEDENERLALMNIVIVGGGPTGVELSGTIAEMKLSILPKDYPELDFSKMNVYLLEASDRLLNGMSEKSSEKAKQYLEKLKVKVYTQCRVMDYDNSIVKTADDLKINTKTLIWASGIVGNKMEGLENAEIVRGRRLKTDQFNRLIHYNNIFVIGDLSYIEDSKFLYGYPQVAQVALQQAKNLSVNLILLEQKKTLIPFKYTDLGSMATVGRNLAVVDLPFIRFQGFFAWLFWMFVHLMAIVGVKNRVMIFINWCWNYITFDQSLRLILKAKSKE